MATSDSNLSDVHAADADARDAPLSSAAEIDALYASDAVGLLLLSRDLTFVRINRALAETNGLSPEEHVGRRVADVVPAVAEQAERMMGELIRTRSPIGPFDIVGETPARPGDVRIWTQSWTPVFDRRGEVAAASIIAIDVTEARRAQSRLEARADDVRRVLDGVIAFVGRLDPDGTLTEANQPAIDAGGLAREDVIGRKFWDCYWWSYSEASQARLKAAVARAAQGEAQRYDAEIRVAGDARMWIDFQLIPQRDAAGRVIELVPSAVDITDRRRAEAALRTSLGRLRTILTTAQVGIAIAHADGRVTEANGSFLEMIGRSVEDLRAGEIDWHEHVTVDSTLGWRKLLRNRTLGPLELTLRRRGGREMPTLASAALLDTPERELVGFFLDRTRQEADAAHRELLLLELKHRVKNMLATVQAIARQTARHHEDREEMIEAFMGRLHAMARAHDLITERNSGRVCLRDLILAQVGPYANRDGQLDWEGPAMQVQPDVAGSLGLVLHEMATNAAKYGALSTPDGSVSIRWGADAQAPGVRISWVERGGPPVAPPQRRGFGTSLIESSLSHAHGGELALDYAPSGLVAEMSVPASSYDG